MGRRSVRRRRQRTPRRGQGRTGKPRYGGRDGSQPRSNMGTDQRRKKLKKMRKNAVAKKEKTAGGNAAG